jgi:hypothetical protein
MSLQDLKITLTLHKDITVMFISMSLNALKIILTLHKDIRVSSTPCLYPVKGKRCPCALTEHHAMRAYWGSGGIAPRILDLGTRWI